MEMKNLSFWQWLAGITLALNAFFGSRMVSKLDSVDDTVRKMEMRQVRMEEQIIRLYGVQGWSVGKTHPAGPVRWPHPLLVAEAALPTRGQLGQGDGDERGLDLLTKLFL
jgi:hypothetical protein